MRHWSSHGTGDFQPEDFLHLGRNVIFEAGVLVFHPDHIHIADNVYVGHQTILKGYHAARMQIDSGVWIGQQCFLHSAGGLTIERDVGIGPGCLILTSTHEDPGRQQPIMEGPLVFAPVRIGQGADIGARSVILPGVTIGRGAWIGAGAVVTKDVPDFAVAVGNPARVQRFR